MTLKNVSWIFYIMAKYLFIIHIVNLTYFAHFFPGDNDNSLDGKRKEGTYV